MGQTQASDDILPEASALAPDWGLTEAPMMPEAAAGEAGLWWGEEGAERALPIVLGPHGALSLRGLDSGMLSPGERV